MGPATQWVPSYLNRPVPAFPALILWISFLLLVPVVVAADPSSLGADDPLASVAPSAPQEPLPVDPQRTLDDATKSADGSLRTDRSHSGSAAHDPTGGYHGIDDVANGVTNTLTEDYRLTALSVLALAGAALSGWVFASRYVDPRLALRNPQRSMLYGFIKGNPGVHLKQLGAEFRMKTSTVLWHVRKLENADLVRSKKANGYRVFYPVSGGVEARRLSEAVTALSNANARGIFSYIVERSGASTRVITAQLAINPGTVRWHLKKLIESGLLDAPLDPRHGTFMPTELGLRVLHQLQESPSQFVVSNTPAASLDANTTEPVSAYP